MANNMKKKKYTEEQMKEKIISDINDIKIHTMMNDKKNNNDINILTKNNFNMTTEIKIPCIKQNIDNQNNNKKKLNKNGLGYVDGFRTDINYKGNNNFFEDIRKTK